MLNVGANVRETVNEKCRLIPDYAGWTALHWAVAFQDLATVHLLLDSGARTKEERGKQSPLMVESSTTQSHPL